MRIRTASHRFWPRDTTRGEIFSTPRWPSKLLEKPLESVPAQETMVEPHFHPDSYGYRPGKSALDAVGAARQRCWRYDWIIDLDVRGFFGAPGQAWRFQRVKFPPRQGEEPLHRELSLGLMEATTWAKRRQSDARAVTRVKRLSLVTRCMRRKVSICWSKEKSMNSVRDQERISIESPTMPPSSPPRAGATACGSAPATSVPSIHAPPACRSLPRSRSLLP